MQEQSALQSVLEQHLAVNSDPCPMCSYNLHKLKGSNCPECGHALVLRVAVTNPRMAAFYTGLVGLASGFGFASLLLLLALFLIVVYSGTAGPAVSDLLVLLVETIVIGALIVLWVRSSGRIRRFGAAARWSLALGACVLSVVAMVVFAATVS